MRIIQQKRRKPCDVTHRGHLCGCTVFSQPSLPEQNNFLFGIKPQTNITLTRARLLDNTFTCTCALTALTVWLHEAKARRAHPLSVIYRGKSDSYQTSKHFPQNAETSSHTVSENPSESSVWWRGYQLMQTQRRGRLPSGTFFSLWESVSDPLRASHVCNYLWGDPDISNISDASGQRAAFNFHSPDWVQAFLKHSPNIMEQIFTSSSSGPSFCLMWFFYSYLLSGIIKTYNV